MTSRTTRCPVRLSSLAAALLALPVLVLPVLALPGLAAAGELPRAKPEKVGMSSERLERIAPVMQRLIDEGRVVGIATAIARDGHVVHEQQLGQIDLESGRALPADAIYRIYSMSKPVAAVALMILFEEGRFLLGDPAAKYIPELASMQVATGPDGTGREPMARPITMRQVLSHTAGFGYGITGPAGGPVDMLYAQAGLLERDQTLAEMIQKLVKLPLLYQPGTSWTYSVANDVQGRLVEVLSGQPFDEFLQARIFGPLDMRDTGFVVPDSKLDRFTSNYLFADGEAPKRVDGPDESRYRGDVRLLSGGGGLVSTTRDYLRFAQMLAGGGELDGVRILSSRTLELMTLDHLPAGVEMQIGPRGAFEGIGYGLGFGVVTDQARAGSAAPDGAYWWGGAANTSFWVDPSEGLVGVIMTQRFPGALPLGNLLQSLAYQAIID